MNNNIKIVGIIGIIVLIIFFSYNLFFSPMAQCVNSLKKEMGGIKNHQAKLVCIKDFGIKG